MAGKRKPAADPAVETKEPEEAVVATPEPAADPAVEAAQPGYETKVVTPRNRVLSLDGQPVPVPAGHVHSWERGRREDGTQVYRCACGEERPR